MIPVPQSYRDEASRLFDMAFDRMRLMEHVAQRRFVSVRRKYLKSTTALASGMTPVKLIGDE